MVEYKLIFSIHIQITIAKKPRFYECDAVIQILKLVIYLYRFSLNKLSFDTEELSLCLKEEISLFQRCNLVYNFIVFS